METLQSNQENTTSKEIVIELPENIKQLLGADLFTLEDSVDPTMLNKYLFYMPEVIRAFGLGIAQLKDEKRRVERLRMQTESRILLDTAFGIDAQRFKNEQLRTAKVVSDPKYMGLQERLDDIDKQIDSMMEDVWKYKNLLSALDNIAKLRISERRF